jgi:predicted molibdopterin-dependent oxidoreductase YjgC
MGVAPHLYPGGLSLKDQGVRSRLASFWGAKLPVAAGLDLEGMLAAGRAGGLHAMWIVGSDPARDYPGAGSALDQIPMLVVQDLFMTETAARADIVLPAASFAETEGSFTNLTGRLQATRTAKRAPGQARPDWWILVEVARRMAGGERERDRATAAWSFASPAAVLIEIAKVVPDYRGIDYAAMQNGGWQPAGFQPGRRAAPRRTFVRVDQEPIARHPDYPLLLVTGHLLYDRGTLLRRSDRVQALVPPAFVQIHPADAERLGLMEGEEVSVASQSGALDLVLKIDDGVAIGTAFVPHNLSDVHVSVLFENAAVRPRVRIEK